MVCYQDKKWYRGRIIAQEAGDYFTVYLVDCGLQVLVHVKNILTPLERFLHLPEQAIEMYLDGIDQSEQNNSEDAKKLLASLIGNKMLMAFIIQDSPSIYVDLFDTSGKHKVNIAARLRDHGIAWSERGHSRCFVQPKKYLAG